MDGSFIRVEVGDSPLVAVAIHDGHALRSEVDDLIALTPLERLREEDAFTGRWTSIAPTRVIGLRSRFEVDLNRRRERAVYLGPHDAWGLDIWRYPPPVEMIERSLELYDAFYAQMYGILDRIQQSHGQFLVYDLHSYNHRRAGPDALPSPANENPQINVCTGGMDLERCEPVVDCFVDTLRAFDFPGGTLDVRRNIRFRATRFSRWVHENFPGTGVSIALEIKKFYMDEWTGEPDESLIEAIREALASTVEPTLSAMHSLPTS